MSDPNQPPSQPGPEQPQYPTAPPTPATPPPPPGYGQQPPPPPGYGQQPYPAYGQQPAYGVPQYPTGPTYPQYQAPPPNPYAHWGYRVGAYLLDNLLLVPLYVVGSIGLSLVEDPTLTEDTHTLGIVISVVAYLAMLGFSVWNTVLRQGRTGSSLGKQWVGIAVISEQTGTPIGGWRTFGRSLLHVLDALACFVGYLWPLWDDKRQTFADKIMSTIVVMRAPAQPTYPQAPGYPAAPGYPQT